MHRQRQDGFVLLLACQASDLLWGRTQEQAIDYALTRARSVRERSLVDGAAVKEHRRKRKTGREPGCFDPS